MSPSSTSSRKDPVREGPVGDQEGADAAAHPSQPYHVAVTMDGNGRWAAERNLHFAEGYRRGAENITTVASACIDQRVRVLTLHAFSTENWLRPTCAVDAIFAVMCSTLRGIVEQLGPQRAQIRHLGDPSRIPPSLRAAIGSAVEATRHNDGLIVNLAIDYGGRDDIMRAVRRMLQAQSDARRISEQELGSHLMTGDLRDPDLIIRTGGRMRLSNFLLWQAAYAELYFTPTLWPDFGKAELAAALGEYSRRVRTLGRRAY